MEAQDEMQRLVHSTSRSLRFLTKTASVKPACVRSGSLFRSTAEQSHKRNYSSAINRKIFLANNTSPFIKELAIRTQICGSKSLFEQKNYLFIRNVSNAKKNKKLRKNRRRRDLFKAIKILMEKKLDGKEIPQPVLQRIEYDLENPEVIQELEANPRNLKHTVEFYLTLIQKMEEEQQIRDLADQMDNLENKKLEEMSPELVQKVKKYIEQSQNSPNEISDSPFEEFKHQIARERNENPGLTDEEIAALEQREDEFKSLVPMFIKQPAFLENMVHEGQILERPMEGEEDDGPSATSYGSFQNRMMSEERMLEDDEEDIESDNLFSNPEDRMVYTPTGPVIQRKNCCPDFKTAVQNKHLDCLTNLVKHFQGTHLKGENALHIAALMDDTTVVGKLITEKGLSVNSVNNSSTSPLHLACSRGNFEMIKLLIDSGSNINAVDESGITPLHLAVQAMLPVEAIEYMIKKGAKVVYRDTEGLNAIHVAAIANRPDLLRLFVAKGLSINDWTKEEETPIHLACMEGAAEFLQAALSYAHADVNAPNRYGETPLHYAAKHGRPEIIELLLTSGASLNVKDIAGASPIHVVAARGYADCLKQLLQRFPSYVEQPNSEGWTPLHIAVQRGNFECVKLLLENGAIVNTRNEYGYSALLLAAATAVHELEEETQRLNEEKMSNTDDKFMSPTEINNIICGLLLEQRPEVSLPDNFGQTPLMFACYNNNITLVKQLLEQKAEAKLRRTTDHVTALHIALHEQNWEIADLLLEAGADVNAENDEGVTPLHIAVAEQNIDMAKKLLKMKANPNSMTNDGLTALKIAQQNEHREMVDFLAANGAKELDLFTILEDDSLRQTIAQSDKRIEGDEH